MTYPALDVRGADADLVLGLVDDFAPTAVEDLPDGISVYFTSASRRDEAQAALAAAMPTALLTPRDVDDEDWARRSQQNLTPITIGRITVSPPWFAAPSAVPEGDGLTVVISPSMGFGTGHHATTRLCLAALQRLHVQGRRVLDVGTGSGVLAIAAARLGAADSLGIDVDPDAILSARENIDLNPDARGVRLETVDVRDAALPQADIVLANLTAAVLVQNARLLRSAVSTGGTLIVSGVQTHERDEVIATFGSADLQDTQAETGWVALTFNFSPTAAV
jgi:ribosomal protein L11 methyltransferase